MVAVGAAGTVIAVKLAEAARAAAKGFEGAGGAGKAVNEGATAGSEKLIGTDSVSLSPGAGAVAIAAADIAAAAGASSAGACGGAGVSGLGAVLLSRGGRGEEGGGPSVAWSSGGGCAGDSGRVGGASGSEGGKVYTAAARPLSHLQTRADQKCSQELPRPHRGDITGPLHARQGPQAVVLQKVTLYFSRIRTH